MHRGQYNPPPAHSPPLHHPVPQHVSTVPQLRSPPPPTPQSQQGGYTPQQGQQQHQGVPFGYPNAFTDFASDPTAQLGIQATKHALAAGQGWAGAAVNRYIDIPALKHLFNVSNSYVLTKTYVILFPWRHRPWSRQQRMSHSHADPSSGGEYLPPREDINSPDLYIPTMTFVTYILLNAVLAGVKGTYHPRLLSMNFGTTASVLLIEFLFLKGACYFLSIRGPTSPSGANSQWLELIAYSGYKFIGIIFTLLITSILGGSTNAHWGWLSWSIFLYCFLANGLFYVRSLRWMLLPDSAAGGMEWGAPQPGVGVHAARAQKGRRTKFLFAHSYVAQLFFMWILTR
ncbi:YIF1-domain-containing protein [Pseudovirgaria hyperparasitica]|uniref:Protein YIF1 n=1 Tax=Pseudovirgaria hyperparasitica TaxID=470096 RepID=A0A6A6WI05_9PEZI|nr:YIF1-domain-containing protein [Pseudovirgaria hyperparasitica]KAF2762428.1 YIF1-domain-containing protein [Pseudovirgaria hyperparasitica]